MKERITNFFQGRRRKTLDEKIDLKEALNRLQKFNGDTKGNIAFRHGSVPIQQSNVPIRDIEVFVEKEFTTNEKQKYEEIKHQVYCGKKNEKHYLTYLRGTIEREYGTTIIKDKPNTKGSVDFVVVK